MARVYGLSKDGIKAFNEGNVILKFSKRKGWEVRTYTSLTWVKKALLKARKDGRFVQKIYNEGSVLCIVFSERGFGFVGDHNAYRQFSTYPDTVTIIKPMSWEYGFIRKKKYL